MTSILAAAGTLVTVGCPLPFTLRAERASYILAFGFITLALASHGLAYFERYSVATVRAFALAWYVALAAYALIRYHRRHQPSWLLVSAVALGGAMAIKHLALVAALILGTTLVLTTLVRATPIGALRRALLFTVIAVAIPLPWYARAYAASGNPVFPDLYGVFGAAPPERWNELTERGLANFKSRFGRERTLSNLVALPWDVTVHGARYGGSLGPLFLLLVPAAFIRRSEVLPKVIAGALVGYVAVERQAASGAMDGLALMSPQLRECCLRELYRDGRFSLHALLSAVDLSGPKERVTAGTRHAWE